MPYNKSKFCAIEEEKFKELSWRNRCGFVKELSVCRDKMQGDQVGHYCNILGSHLSISGLCVVLWSVR